MNFDFKPKFHVERWTQFHAPNAAMLRLQMEQEGYRVYQWSDRAGMIYALHKHETAQSHWIVSGELELTVGGQSYVLKAGDRDFLAAETWHSARVSGETAVVYLIGEKILASEEPVAEIKSAKKKSAKKTKTRAKRKTKKQD